MLKNTYICFWAIALIILIVGYFINSPDENFVVNQGDTYYVIANGHLALMLALCYFISGLPYLLFWWLKRRPSAVLTKIHFTVMAGGFVLYYIALFIIQATASKNPMFDYSSENTNTLCLAAALAFILVQPVFLVNIVLGAVRKYT